LQRNAIATSIHYSIPSCLIGFFHIDTRAFSSLLRVVYAICKALAVRAIVICYITDITLSRMTLLASVVCYITDITRSQWLLGRQPCSAQYSALAPHKRWRKCL